MVAVRETHSSIVVLIGGYAYKIKKPVDLGFLDFRTHAARRADCVREIELNRRLAPDVYFDLADFDRPDGPRHEPVVVMRRMPERARLSTLIEQNQPVERPLRALARRIAAFHATADRGPEIARAGRADRLWARWSANLQESERFCPAVLEQDVHRDVAEFAERYVSGRDVLLDERSRSGLVVDGHGDLTAEDVFCLDDGPRVLDCLEFDDRLRWVDVLDDVAFLAMDLERLGRPDLGAGFVRDYLQFSGTWAVPSLLHHYIAYRAFVRAKVAAIRAEQGDPRAGAVAAGDAGLALAHLRRGEVRLVLVGGGPGTGKSTVTERLADRFGWMVLSSDMVRDEIEPRGADRYRPRAREAVYAVVLQRAEQALRRGIPVIVDATWTTVASRQAAAVVAERTASRLIEVECHAPTGLAAERAQRRFAEGTSHSEADAYVARTLAAQRDPWPSAVGIDTSGTPESAFSAALSGVAFGPV